MDDAVEMGVVHGIADSCDQFKSLARAKAMGLGVFEQGSAVDEFHCKVGLPAFASIGGAGLVDLCDPGVLELAEQLGLMPEPAQQACGHHAGPNDLEGDT